MGITIKDIARECGVGISTVSRVINNNGYVSDELKERVLKAVAEYNYIPNNNARNLKARASKNIALLVKGISNPFFSIIITVIEQKIALRGYSLLIHNVEANMDELDIAIKEQQDRNLCGILLLGGSFNYSDERFERLKVPCVLVTISASDGVSKEYYSSVCIDDEKEGFRATEYLISLGHRRVGFIFLPSSNVATPNSRRYQGYLNALKQYDIPFDPKLVANELIAQNPSGYFVGFNAMKQLYMRNPDMTAVFAFADTLAIGAAKAAISMGLNIPNDISIMGFDGIEAAEFNNPAIDTMYQPAGEMALSSIEILFDMLQGGKPQHLIYNTVLTRRGSCRQI